mmetsp:Transcript_14560/g.49702  ORF Transcript_14560/g.49702 Transcript_14560/m.49702 type:complete len:120 (-) Transcript_14560:23-382(-)
MRHVEHVRDAMDRCRGIIEQGEALPPTRLSPDPHQLREEIIARTGLQVEARTFRPHISLLYGVLDFDKREEIARALNERFFDESEDLSFKLHKVALVESPVPGYDGIGDWKVVSEIDIQ